MKHFTKSCTLLIILFSANFALAQCPVPASAVAFTATPSSSVCAQNDITFTITNPDPVYTYTWDFDDASSSSNTAIGTNVTHSFSPNTVGGSHNVTVTATPSAGTVQPVSWTNINSDITALNGNSLIRSSGSGWNSGAESTQSINDNMYVEYIAGLTNNRLMCGFGVGNTSNGGFSTIDFALYTRYDGQVLVYENGSYKGQFGTYSYGDTMRVAVENGIVHYYQNGNLIYTSSQTPSFPMFVDASIYHTNDTLHNVIIGSSCTGSNSTTITTNPTPEIDITGTWDRCIAVDNLGFTNTLFQVNNYDPALTYTWDFGDGGGPSNLVGNIQTHTYNTHGVYDVTITTTNGSCIGTYTNQVLYLERPLADMVIVGTADICEGDTIYVANNTDTTSIDYFVLDWGDGTRDTTTNTDTLSHVYNFSDVFACTISQGGEPYTITLYAVNACFEHTNSSPITVTATPRTNFSAPDIVCETINATGGVNFSSAICPAPTDIFSDLNNYIWDFGDPSSGANSSTFSSPTHVFTGPGDYEVTVQLISNCGSFYDTMNVIVLENPNAGYSFLVNNPPANTTFGDGCAPIEVQFTNSSSGDSVTYNWMVQSNIIGGANFINGTSDTSMNPEIGFTLPGDYIVTLSATNQCTTTTFVDTITVLDGPTVNITPPNPTCDVFLYTPNVVYGGGGGAILTYDWSFPGAFPASSSLANPSNILYFSSGTYQAFVEITNECTVVRDTVTFYVPRTPTPVTLTANGNQTTCLNSAAFNLSADSTGGSWSGNGITNTTLGTFNPLLAGVGTHTITYTYQPRVCASTTTIDIVVNALPIVSASGDTSLCISDGIMTLGGENPTGGAWSGVGITDANLGIFDPVDSGPGVFPVNYTYTDGNGCTNTDSRDVRVFALPVLNLGGDKTECNGPDDIPLLAAPSGGTWSGMGINSANSTFNAITAGGLGTYKAYYDYTDGNGCESRDSINIDVVNGVTANAGSDTSLCETGSPVELTNGIPTGGVWQGTGVFNTGGNYFFHPSIAGAGSHNIIYSVGSGSCEERDTSVVVVVPIPSVNTGIDTSVCVNSPAFDMSGFTPTGGTWSGTGITGISFDPSIGQGTYNLTYSYTDPVTGCENTDIRVVTVNAIPNVIASPAATECNINSDLQLTGFSPGGGTWTGAGIINATFGTFNPNTAGGLSFDGSDTTYSLTYTYTDFNGCIDAATTDITVTFGDTVEAGPDDTLCINSGSFALSGFTPIAGGSWSGNGIAGSTFFPTAAGLGTHTLTFTYGIGSCLKTDTKTILVLDIPAVNAGNDTLICENTNPIQLVPFSPVGGVWTGSGVVADTFDPAATGDGTFILSYTYTDPTSGCSNTDTKTITVSPLPNVTTNGADIYCFNTSDITLTNYNPAGGTWSGAGITNANNGIFNGSTAGGLGFNDADTLYPVTYSYTDNNGCTNSDVLNITITDGIDAFAGVDDTICQYDPTFIINGFSPAGGTWSGNGIVNANTGQFDPTTVSPGTYNLIYRIGSGTCQDADTMSILIVPTPVVEAGSNIEICADNSVFTLTGFSPLGGTWSGTGITDSLMGVFDPIVSGTGTFTLTYTYAEPINGCENSDTRTIIIHSLPSITMSDTLMYCNSGGDITISGYTPTGGLWSGQGITDANAGIFNTTIAGGLGYNDADTAYQLLYIYTDANGCIDSSDLTLMLILGDTIDAGPDLAMCVTDVPVTFTGFTPSSGGTWSGAGIVNASLGTFDPSIGAGNYTVTYTHGNGTCLKTDNRDIIVGAVPTVIAGNDIDYCITEPQDTLTGFSPSGGTWSGQGVTDTTNGYFHPDTAGAGSFLITYTFTNSLTGCENSDTRMLDVKPLPIVNVGDTVRYCDNSDNIAFSGYSPLGGTWSGSGIIDATNGIFNTIVAGGIGVNNTDTTYPVIYTIINGDGCVASDTLAIIVEFGDTVLAASPIGVCIDDGLITLSGYSPVGGTWSGVGIIDGANGIFDPTAANSNTLNEIIYTVGSGTCQKSDTTTIFVGLIPSVEAGVNDTICSADPAFALSNYVPSTGGVWSGNGITDPTNGIFDPSVAGVGTWTLTYSYTNTFTGCENSDTKLITVRPAPTVSAGNDRTECNSSTDITLSGYSPLGGIWSGAGIIDANNGIFNTIIAGGVGVNNTPAVYTLTYTYTDGIGCTNSDIMQFIVEFGDTVDAGAGFNICENAGLQTLVGSPLGGTWSGTGVIDPNGVFDPLVPAPGAFYTLTYTFGIGSCQKTDDIQVFVSPEITVNAGPDITVCLSAPVFNLTGNSPSSGGTWSGIGITDANTGAFDPVMAGLGNHTITFDYINVVTGCQGSDTRIVSVVDIPIAEAGAPVTYCNNANNITLSGYSPLGGTWSGAGIVDGINGIFNTVSAGGLGFNQADTTYQVVYTYSSGSSCIATDTLDITVEFGEIVNAGLDDTLCIDDGQLTLVGSPVGGTWSGSGIIDPFAGTFDPTVSGAGSIILTYTHGTGTCEKSDDVEVFVGALPTINPGANDIICIDNGILTMSGYSPQGGVWSGTGIVDGNAGTFDPNIGIGTYTLTYIYANPITGCDSSVTKTVTVHPLPNVTAPDTVEYCNTTADISIMGLAAPVGGSWTGMGVTNANGTFNASVAGGIGAYTITYLYTDGNGCENTTDMVVNIIFGDTVYAGINDTLCIDDPQVSLVGSPAGGTWSGNGIVDANLGIFDPSTATAGLHTLTYTYGTGTCEKTDDVNILVGALPIINPGANDVVCLDNGILTLSGYSPQGGVWSGTGIVDGNAGTFDPSIGIGTYTLTYTYANPITDCDSSVTKTVTVNPLPTVNASDVTFCDNINDISLNGLGAPNNGTWSGLGVVDASGLFNSNIAGGIGSYTLIYTFTDANGCSNSDNMVVDVIFGDTVEAGPDLAMCVTEGLINMTDYSPLGGLWSGNGIIDANNGTFDPSQVNAGFHTLTYTFGIGSCLKTDTRTIYVDTIPTVTAGPDISVCQQSDSITISTGSPGGGYWLGAGVDSTGGFTPQNMSVGTFNLAYTYVNTVTGCQNTDTLVITVEAPPVVDAGTDDIYCNTNQNITLSGQTPASGGLWNGPGIIDGINGIFNTQTAGGLGFNDGDTTYQVIYTFTNNNGCFNRDTLDITVEFGDLVDAGLPDTICIDNGQFVLGGYTPLGGTWSGTGVTDPNLGIFDPIISGTGTHILTYTSGIGSCQKSDTKTIFVDALPIISAGVDETICIDNGTITLSGYTPQGGVWGGTGITDPNLGIFDPSVSNIGVFTLTYTFSNPITGCSETDIKLMEVAPLPNVTAGGTVTYCNTPNQITISDYTTFSPNGGVWSGSGVVNANSGIFSTVIAGGLASDGSDTTYNLTYTFTDGNGCVNSDVLVVTVTYGDTVVAGNNQSICIDAGLIVLTDFSPSNGTWSGAGVDPAGIFDPTVAGFGTHILTYTFGSGTCQKNATKTIFVGQPPVISAGVDETVCIDNGQFSLQGYSPFGGYWLGTGVDSSGIFDPSVGVGSYTLTYTFVNSVTGCEASDTKTVTVAPLPSVTTANTALYCDIASNITLTGYTPSGGIWTGVGIVDGSLGLFNTTQAGGLATNGGDTTYTLTYTYTDGNGCINSNTTDVTVTFGDTVVAGANEATCIDAGLLNLTGFSPAGGTFSGTGIIDPIAGVFDPALAGGGTHLITYTFGSGTCEKESTKTIFVGTDPVVEAGPNLSRCIDEGLFQLTNYSPLGGIWSGVGVTDAINGFFDPAVAGDGTWTLTYSYTNSITGCEASDTRIVTIHPLPIVTAPDSLEFCNTTTNITLSGFAPLGGTWIGTGIVDQNNGVFNTTIAGGVGVYDIEYRYTDINGCTNNDSTVITVIFGDTVEAGPDLAVCISDAPLLLTGFQPVGGTWTGPGITDPSGVFDPQVAGSGLHTITISFGMGTCLKTDSRDVFVGEIPNVIAGANDAVCGQDADYMLTGFSPPGGYWLGNGVDSTGLFSPASATPGTWILTYTYVNPITGCENSATKEVFVETPPAVDAGGTVTYCNSTSNISLNQHSPIGGVWSGAGIIDGLNGIFNTTAAGGLAFDGSDTTYFAYYEFISGTGCFGRDTLDIIVTFGDTVNAGVDDTICIDGGQLNLTGFSPAGGTWSGNGIIDNVLGIFDPANAGVGLHTLSYTYGIGTCEKTDNKTVFVGALPVINPGVDELVCIDEPIFTLSNFSPQGGYWIGVGVDSVGVFDPATAGVGTWTLTYTFVNSITGCDHSETKEVTVAPLPAVVVPDSIEYCANPNDITLSGYSPSGGSWSGTGIVSANAGIFSTVLAGGLATNGADTTYPVIYTFTDINGCTNRDTMAINVIFGDTVNAGPDMNICITDGLITLGGYTPASGGIWSGLGIIDANAGIFDPNVTGGGTFTVCYTFGTETCEKEDCRTIFVGTVPSVDAGPDILVCEDQAAFTLNSFSPVGGVWSGTGITDSINAIFDPQITGTGTFILVYDYVNTTTGCENFDTREVLVAPLPVVDIDDSLEFCINNNNIPLTDYVSTTPTTGLTWNGSGIVDPSDGVFNATIAGGIGQYAVVINYVDVNGCSNNDTLVIDVIFGDTVEAGPDDTLCINDNPILLTGFSPIGGVFSGAGVDAVSGTFDPVTAGAGLHTITYTFGTGTCEKTDTRTILVGNLPSINIGPDQTVCIDGGSFTLSAYSPQGGTWAGVGITDQNVGIFNIDSAGVGTHILTYTFANSITGCENTAQRTITVAPLPVVEAGNPILICDNPDDYTIPTSTYSPNGGTWSGQGIVNASAGVFNTVIAGGLGFNNADTTYPVIYTFTDGNSCTNFDTLDITVEFGDSILAGLNEALCIDIGLHQLTGFLPSTNGLWTGPGISDPINGIFDPQAAGPGAHTVTISVGTGTCAKSDDKIIFVGTPPAVNPGNDQAVCADDTSFAFAGFSPPGGIWSGVGITDSINAIFDPQVSGTGTFVLTYTFVNSVTNCETVATKQVTVNPLPFIDAGDTVTYCDNPNDIVLSGYTPSSGGFWSGPGITNPSQGIFSTGQAGGIGIYNLIYDYTEPFTGCENKDTLVVDVIFGDTVVAGPNDTLCIQDLPINLQGSPAGGTWTGTGITNGNLGTFNPAIAQGGTHIMTYTFGVGTCEKTDTKIIFVGEPDPLDAGNDQVLCVDAPPITLTASLPTGVWSGNGITNTMTGEFNAGVALVGLHNIVYTYTNAITGCVSMDTLVIEVKPLPVVNTAGAITYCEWPLNVQLPTPNLTPGVWNGAGIVDINNGIFNSIVAGGLGANGVDTIYPITYTHTDAFGCSNNDILNVTITYGDSVLAGPDITACIDDNPITLVGTPVGGTWSGFGVTDPTGVFNPGVGIGGGNFDVIYTQGAGTCVKSDTLIITIIDVTGTTAGVDEEFCYEDGLVTLTGNSPLGGIWTGPGIQDGNLGTFLTQAVSTGINPDTVQVCYTFTDALSGCDYTDCKNVIVRPLPVVGFTSVDTACVNDVITFTNTSIDAISFQWYFGDGDSSIFLTPTHVYDTSGLYTVMLIAYSDYGCPDTMTKDILIYEIPQAGFAMNTNDGCGPLTVGFTNATTNQDQNLTYSWDFGNGLTSSQANPPAQTYNAGVEDTVYVVSLVVNNLCGTTTFTDSITVRANPAVVFVADDNYGCGPLVVNFSNASTGGPNSYLWNFGPFGASTDTIPPAVSFTITDTVAVTYWVTLTATNACGTDIDSLPITVIPGSVNAGIGTSVTEGCEPLTVDFTSAVQPGDNIQWVFGDGNGSILDDPTHVFDTVGTFTVLQIVTNQCGSDTATIDITVHPQPPMSISHDPFVCVGSPMQFYNNSNPISGTEWAFGDGDSSVLTNPQHVYTTPGIYTVYVTNYSITHLCPITDSTIVEVKDIPNASFTLDDMDGCSPLTVNFTNNSTGIFNAWAFINGISTDTVPSIVQSPTHVFTEPGQHYVTLRTSDQFGCFDDTTITGIVVHPDPVAAFTPDVDQQCGLDALVTLENNSTSADAYYWDFGNGTFSNVTSPTISYNNVGDHTIFLEASNIFGCKDTLIDEITVYPSPNADFDIQPQTGCEPLTVQFLQLATNTNGYFWDFGNGETSIEANPIHTYSAGAYNVTFVASIDDVCYDTIVIADAVFAEGSPIADFEILQSDPDNPTGVIDFVNNSIGATEYEWEFGDGTFSSEYEPSKEYLENGQRIVRLIVWNDQGCSDTLIQIVEPLGFKGLFVPNAFSPDAGIGDVRVFRPIGVSIETYKAQVFSQWGELLWESEALDDAGRPTESWDGMYKGSAMPQGAYVWKVEAVFVDGSIWEGQKNTLGQTKKLGSVTLLR